MARVAKDSGLGRESLYKALGAGAHPRYETVSAVLRALGVKLTIVASDREPQSTASRRKAFGETERRFRHRTKKATGSL